jgi:carbon storage regulator CsrA
MLVLTRKIQQQIQIGDSIRITILQVKGNSVRVGIEAPRDVRILRCEVKDESPADAEPEPVMPKSREHVIHEHVMRDRARVVEKAFSSPEPEDAMPTFFVAAHASADGPEWPERNERIAVRAPLAGRVRPILERLK